MRALSSYTPLMQIYLVGGAVRDQLLGLPVHERDYVVVGATPEQMLAQGFTPVGRDFPVFLHPQTKAEYALARTERKQGVGYHGFVFNTDASVTVESDLERRDLTINAMALADNGDLIDPYGGRDDLQQRKLRHVSVAFAEDPLRVLRVARFAARFADLGFQVVPETKALMAQLTRSGELTTLTPERVWKETEKALATTRPDVFFELLREVGALAVLMPELDRLWGIPNPEKWHPEIDTGVHTMMVLRVASALTDDVVTRFAALAHDFGKGETAKELWPSHRDHEEAGVPVIENFCTRLKIPTDHKDLAVLCSRLHLMIHRGFLLRPGTVVRTIVQADGLRRPDRFAKLLLTCESDFRGRLHWHERAYPQRAFWQQALVAARSVSVKPLLEMGLQGEQLAKRLFDRRVQEIAKLRTQFDASDSVYE